MKHTFIFIFLSCSILSFGQKRNIELSDIWASGTFYPKTVNGFVNMKDGKSYCVQERTKNGYDAINQYVYLTGTKIKELLNSKDVFGDKKYGINSYAFSQDQSMMLIYYNSKKIYRSFSLTYASFVPIGLSVGYRTSFPSTTTTLFDKSITLKSPRVE